MHICLVNRWYPDSACCGGIAAYIYNLAHQLSARGHRVTVIASRATKEIPAKLFDSNIEVFRIYSWDFTRWAKVPFLGRYARTIQLLLYSILVAIKLWQLERGSPPDVIEFAEVEAEGFVYLLKKNRKPVIVRCHTPMFVLRKYYTNKEQTSDMNLIAWAEKFCIRRANYLTSPSDHMRQIIIRECRLDSPQFSVIPNGIDTMFFQPITKTENAKITVLCVSRLERVKGIMVLAEAIPKVIASIPNVRFVYVGLDKCDENGARGSLLLKKIIEDKKMTPFVSILTGIDQNGLLKWYHQADVAVIPSLVYESFSYTCAQAMACGIPVVASRIGGIPETVDDGVNGYLVSPGDSDGFAKAIRDLASNGKLRFEMGQAGITKAQREFDSRQVAGLFLEVVQKVLSKSRNGK